MAGRRKRGQELADSYTEQIALLKQKRERELERVKKQRQAANDKRLRSYGRVVERILRFTGEPDDLRAILVSLMYWRDKLADYSEDEKMAIARGEAPAPESEDHISIAELVERLKSKDEEEDI